MHEYISFKQGPQYFNLKESKIPNKEVIKVEINLLLIQLNDGRTDDKLHQKAPSSLLDR